MKYWVYILRDQFNHLYIGQTSNKKSRTKQHLSKGSKAAKFVKDGGDFETVYSEEYPSRLLAMRREKQLKSWTRAKKEALIKGDFKLLKAP